jgi:hypothetical protein
VTTFSFQNNTKTSQIRVMNVDNHSSQLVTEDLAASDAFWLSDDEVGYIKSGDNDHTHLVVQSLRSNASK